MTGHTIITNNGKYMQLIKRIKILTLITSLFLFNSCLVHEGIKINGQCRPKKFNFQLSKTPFIVNDKLVLNRLYVIDNVTKDSGYIFYADGKLIYVYSKDGFALKLEDVIGLSWKNAQSVGYWRADDHNRLKTEYFSCSNSGNYLIERGEITSDTISFERDCGSSPFKNKKCLTSYILSNMILN